MTDFCRTYWGTHACRYGRGHPSSTPHRCECCDHPDHGDLTDCVGSPPYYGPTTRFYGEDAPGGGR